MQDFGRVMTMAKGASAAKATQKRLRLRDPVDKISH
jgi:hypothetical protein